MNDILEFRNGLVENYKKFSTSFASPRSTDIASKVQSTYDKGRFWPDPLIQINPNYRKGAFIDELARQGNVEPETAQIFQTGKQEEPPCPKPIQLYCHQTAAHTITIVNGINRLMAEYKAALRPEFGKSYRHELLNHLFYHPYTKIDHTTDALGVTRMTASAYLDKIVKLGLLGKVKVGRVNYYINEKLVDLLVNHEKLADSK